MSNEEGISPAAGRRRTIWIVGAAIAVVVLAVAIVWASVAGGDTAATAPSPSPVPSSSASPDPSVSPSPSPTESSAGEDEEEPDTEPVERPVLDPVPLYEPAVPVEGVTASIVSIDSFDARAAVPGERGGPAVQVTVRIENASGEPAEIGGAMVNMYYGPDRTPANVLVTPREDFPLTVEPGESVTGVVAFSVPADQRSDVMIELNLTVELPVVVFEGSI